jgi:FkbM family methyltransferase
LRYNVAVGDGTEAKNSQLHFNTNKGNGQALTDASRLEAASKGIKIQSVDVASIDSILASKQFAWKKCMQSACNRFFVMKIDVEGFELRALRGSASLFKFAAPPIIMIELAPGTIKGNN